MARITDLDHDEPLTHARIAATLDRLSRLEQACDLLTDNGSMTWLYLLVSAAIVGLGGLAMWLAGAWS